jgi:hypothetical protein
VLLLLCVPVAAVLVWILFIARDGNPSVGSVAALCVAGIVAGAIGFGFLSTGLDSRSRAIDSAVAFLRHSYPDISAYDVRRLLRSPDDFDADVAHRVPNPVAVVTIPNWTPDIVRPILPGPTEALFVKIHRWIGVVGSVCVIVLACVGSSGHVPSHRIWYSGWAIAAAVLLVSFLFWLLAIAKGNREFRAGYSTAPTGTQLVGRGQRRPVDAHTSIDFVDGKTGYLLRHSNAALLRPDMYSQRLAQIRQAHLGEVPTRIGATN